ncbi:ABC transporter ATP-binding protein [Nonomuraea sp. NPDC046570]|uniref:ABC transporter ATP-binding protein n=1 Tax=Nonomuraea sp. NPDC046570 TaxID=3155255 RepID=UPI0033F38B27
MIRDADTGAAVSLRGLHKRFGDVRAVDGVDLLIAPGEVVALLGPNGAGKTTTMEMLLGLTTPGSGEITLFGRSPARATAGGLVGAMLQSGGFLDQMTGREIVQVMAAQYPAPLTVDEALTRAGMLEHAKLRYGGLSGGQKQRVRFAAALVCNPDLLVLDEPTVAMDVRGRQDFWAAMREYTSGGRTVLFATHYLAEAQDFADRVVLMRAGRIIADGSVAEVTSRVGGRTITAAVPDADPVRLGELPGVAAVEVRGEQVRLHCPSSDEALRALLAEYPGAHDVVVSAMSLENAFVALTTEKVS